ncbi:MAG: 50S ribosomal protein L24 [Myxococcota bacterium]
MKIRLKKGDMVKVMTGSKDKKGQVGKVLEIDRKKLRVKIENVFPIKKHIKPQKNKAMPEGGIVNDFGSIHISNVMLMSKIEGA